VLGFVALALSAIGFIFPGVLPGNGSALAGLIILTFTLLGWRAAYSWMVKQPFLRERVYVLGTGDRAQRLIRGLRERSNLGVEVVGWTGDLDGELNRDSVASHLLGVARGSGVHRVIVAMPDRRGTLPVEELLALRLAGVKVEEATSWLERITGRIEVEQLYPSWLIFAEGFRFSSFSRLVRRGAERGVFGDDGGVGRQGGSRGDGVGGGHGRGRRAQGRRARARGPVRRVSRLLAHRAGTVRDDPGRRDRPAGGRLGRARLAHAGGRRLHAVPRHAPPRCRVSRPC